MMLPLDPTTAQLPPALRALAMGLVAETVVPVLNHSRLSSPAPTGDSEKGTRARTASFRDIRWKCEELMALVLQADNPEAAAAYVLRYLPKHVDSVFERLDGREEARRKASEETAIPTAPSSGSRPRS